MRKTDRNDLLRQIRKIEIKAGRLTQNIFSGAYRSAFKGRGMSFSEVREYQYGDDVRDIDWNVTARYARPYIKVYEEERELTMLLLIDVSRSELFGTMGRTKRKLIAEIAGTLAFSTITNNDKVGVIFYSNKVEKFVPPGKGRKHVLHILDEILTLEAEEPGTDLSEALIYANNVQKKRSTIFILSDFLDESDYARTLSIVRQKHDVMAMQVYDAHESELPEVGLLTVRDAETGETMVLDTSSAKVKEKYHRFWEETSRRTRDVFRRYDVRLGSAVTDADFVPALQNLFSRSR